MDILIWYYTNKSDRGHIVKILSISLLIKKRSVVVMKRMTRKLYGILILSMLATSAHAGWLSNLGQRIVNGAANFW